MDKVLVIFGIWFMIDGIGSILLYPNQSFLEQLVRIIRTGIGSALVGYGVSTYLRKRKAI